MKIQFIKKRKDKWLLKEVISDWYGFSGKYKAGGSVYFTGNSYFAELKITDLNWTDNYSGDRHWYICSRHNKTLEDAKRWLKQLAEEPINYVKETWKTS
jgi:hypothetical protein